MRWTNCDDYLPTFIFKLKENKEITFEFQNMYVKKSNTRFKNVHIFLKS